MKYFLPEYYYIINDPKASIDDKKAASKSIYDAYNEYEKYLQKHKRLFSKSFLEEYKKSGFHDYEIQNINFDFENIKRGKALNITICIKHNQEIYHFVHKDVKNCTASLNDLSNLFLSDYLYGEFYKNNDNLWNHNFLFGYDYEINIECKKFVFCKEINNK